MMITSNTDDSQLSNSNNNNNKQGKIALATHCSFKLQQAGRTQ
jgi:hypothetical protein